MKILIIQERKSEPPYFVIALIWTLILVFAPQYEINTQQIFITLNFVIFMSKCLSDILASLIFIKAQKQMIFAEARKILDQN